MADKYVSSIVCRYGDRVNVLKDVNTLNKIWERQGSNLLIDVLAEKAGESANKFKLDSSSRDYVIKNLLTELKEALLERL